jgi:hypothetical protein
MRNYRFDVFRQALQGNAKVRSRKGRSKPMWWAIAVIQAVWFFGGSVYALAEWTREKPDPEIEEWALVRSLSWPSDKYSRSPPLPVVGKFPSILDTPSASASCPRSSALRAAEWLRTRISTAFYCYSRAGAICGRAIFRVRVPPPCSP